MAPWFFGSFLDMRGQSQRVKNLVKITFSPTVLKQSFSKFLSLRPLWGDQIFFLSKNNIISFKKALTTNYKPVFIQFKTFV